MELYGWQVMTARSPEYRPPHDSRTQQYQWASERPRGASASTFEGRRDIYQQDYWSSHPHALDEHTTKLGRT